MNISIQQAVRKRGAVLILILFIGVAILILGLSMIYSGLQGRILAVRNVQSLEAKIASDAGIEYAVNWMNHKLRDPNEPIWDNSVFPLTSSTITLPGSASQFSYVITNTTTYPVTGEPNGFRIVSTGTHAGRTHTATVDLEAKLLNAGILAANDITLRGQFSTLPADAGDDFLVQSNGTDSVSIALKPNTSLPGDVACGPGVSDPIDDGVVEVQPGSTIAGDVYSSSESIFFPPVPVPDTSSTTDIGSITSNTTLDPNLARIHISDIDLSGGETLTVTHSCFIYVSGQVDLGNSAAINVTSGAQVELFVNGVQHGSTREAIDMGNSAWIQVDGSLQMYLYGNLIGQNSTGIINLTGQAANVGLYGIYDEVLGRGCEQIDLKAGSNADMVVYAPFADVTIYNSGDFTGSIVADSVEMKQDVNYTYDTSLAQGSINHFSAYFDRTRWWED